MKQLVVQQIRNKFSTNRIPAVDTKIHYTSNQFPVASP